MVLEHVLELDATNSGPALRLLWSDTINLRISLLIPFDIGRLPKYNWASGLDPLSLAANRTTRSQVTKCPLFRPKRLSASAISPTGEITYVPRGRTTPVAAMRPAASAWEAAHESQALRTLSLYAARSRRSLRSRGPASPVREMRRRTTGEHPPLPTQDPHEAKFRNSAAYPWNGPAKRCPICDGTFGLIRHYFWRTPLCSKKCADRFKARQEDDRRWLRLLQAAA
jgi:hypothetical protein